MPTTARQERLEARVTGKQKALIRRAAAIEGKTLGDFVASNLEAAATGIVERYETMRLGAEDSRVFAEALADPPPPNDALKKALKSHRRLVRSR